MTKELICLVCPRGCSLVVDTDADPATVNGNACPKGAEYGRNEVLNPTRTVTSIVRVENREDTMVSVKTSAPVPKDKMFEVMKAIRSITVSAPIKIGDVIVKDLFGADVIATKDIL